MPDHAPAASVVLGPQEQCNGESYAAMLAHFEQHSAWNKNATYYATLGVWVPTIIILLLCVVCLGHWWFPDAWHDPIKRFVIPPASVVGTILSVLLLVWSPRGNWLTYRAAIEQLREHALRYKLGLAPYNAADHAERFHDLLVRVWQETDPAVRFPHMDPKDPGVTPRKQPGLFGLFFARAVYAGLTRDMKMCTPATVRQNPTDGMLDGRVWDRPGTPQEHNQAARDVVEYRICDQYHWHLRKCARYYLWYIVLLVAYLGLLLIAGWYASFVERDFARTAFLTLIGLSLLGYSDFMAYSTISLRYVLLARALRQYHIDYFGREGGGLRDGMRLPNNGQLDRARAAGSAAEREQIEKLAHAVERLLSSEFRAWRQVHDTGANPPENGQPH